MAAPAITLKAIGSVVACPNCGRSFRKKTKTHIFCSNGRSKRGGNCKDDYWNRVRDKQDGRNDDLCNEDHSWDAHKNVF